MKTIIEKSALTNASVPIPNVQNWVITPVALALNEKNPSGIIHQKWQLVLSGAVEIDAGSVTREGWTYNNALITPDTLTPLEYAVSQFAIPVPVDSPVLITGNDIQFGIRPEFQVEQIASYVAPGSIFDANTSINAGFAVNSWQPAYFDARTPAGTPHVRTLFYGINVAVAVQDIDASLCRINYQITLIGRIIFARFIL